MAAEQSSVLQLNRPLELAELSPHVVSTLVDSFGSILRHAASHPQEAHANLGVVQAAYDRYAAEQARRQIGAKGHVEAMYESLGLTFKGAH